MAQRFIALAVVVCVLAAFVHSAPQFGGQQQYNQNPFLQPQQKLQPQFQPQQYQAQEPERQSRFLVVQDQFHQEPNGEYNFE